MGHAQVNHMGHVWVNNMGHYGSYMGHVIGLHGHGSYMGPTSGILFMYGSTLGHMWVILVNHVISDK